MSCRFVPAFSSPVTPSGAESTSCPDRVSSICSIFLASSLSSTSRMRHGTVSVGLEAGAGWLWSSGRLSGRRNGKRPPVASPGARSFDAPAVQLHELPHQREANAQPAAAAVGGRLVLVEEVERSLEDLGGHATTGVRAPPHPPVPTRAPPDRDVPAARRVLERVADQVREDLLDPPRVRVHPCV